MKRTVTFLTSLYFFSLTALAQVAMPTNTALHSDFEKSILKDVIDRHEIDPFLLQVSVNHNSSSSPENLKTEFTEFIAQLRQKGERISSAEEYISRIYYKTHKKYLRNYKEYSSFNQLLENGTYDCLSGTIIYALILDELGIDFEIVETEYHIYLLAYADGKRFMLETTDPVKGFISNENDIQDRILTINNQNQKLSEGFITLLDRERYIKDFITLAGLQYFNASVEALRNANVIASVDQLEKARLFENSERLKEFGKYLAKVLLLDETLSTEQKQLYLMKLTHFLNEGVLTASI
jgi:hypothetical protein